MAERHRVSARVHAIDQSSIAGEIHRGHVDAADLAGSITVEQGWFAVTDLPDDRYDLIIDSYVSCHILSAEERLRFLDALMSRLRPGGQLYTAGMGDRDSYYHDHLVPGCDVIALDPYNCVAKLPQPIDVAARDGGVLGHTVASTTERFIDAVNGICEWREVHASLFCR